MIRLKKIDALLVTSFIPPFVVTFFIALFVFVMQTLWLYIDDIAGKGVGFFLMVELVGYMSVSMIPMALPVAVLISSVMVLGNLAERYELSSIKSAGVSLWRTMRPLMVVTLTIGVFSFFCSNYFIPVSNLKFKSRLHDIKNQKPALSMEESLFNQDFQGYSIRLGDKLPDNQTIKDVLVYDNRESNQGMLNMVSADSGLMYGSIDGRYFVMHLYDGSQISEPKPVTKNGSRNYPMMRATFKEWTKVFNLDEFELDRTDENLFKSHHTMLSNRQLLIAIDSIDLNVNERSERFNEYTNKYFFFWEKAEMERKKEERQKELLKKNKEMDQDIPEKKNDSEPKETEKSNLDKVKKPNTNSDEVELIFKHPKQIDQPFVDSAGYLSFFKKKHQDELIRTAMKSASSLFDNATNNVRALNKTLESRVKHVFEYHSKYSMAIACFIFLFVGAPMGAIVRKGGFGWPLLISIIFFMLFIIISIFSKNIAERFVIDAVLASWLNCLIIFPMGLVLTYWAMRDMGWSQIIDFFTIKFPNNPNKAEQNQSEK